MANQRSEAGLIVARLGVVLFIIGIVFATLIAVGGLFGALFIATTSTPLERFGVFAGCLAGGGIVFLIGRACLYILAGR